MKIEEENKVAIIFYFKIIILKNLLNEISKLKNQQKQI